MIKLIASDLDGTLLPPSKIMPEKTFEYIEAMSAKGILFVPASGRQLPSVKKMFEPVLDKIAIIAENGGLVWLGGEIIFRDPTPAEGVKYALDIIDGQEGLYPLISCTDCAYYSSENEAFIETVKKSYTSVQYADDLKKVADGEEVLKISVWDEKPCAEHGGIILPPLIKGLRAMISGYDWLDVSAPQANKGRAFEAILKHLGIDRADSAAFGDHMNDYEMLRAAGRAYIPENAFYKLKESGVGEIIGPHRELSVIKKIGELIS